LGNRWLIDCGQRRLEEAVGDLENIMNDYNWNFIVGTREAAR
jgi:hypothetical protein